MTEASDIKIQSCDLRMMARSETGAGKNHLYSTIFALKRRGFIEFHHMFR